MCIHNFGGETPEKRRKMKDIEMDLQEMELSGWRGLG